MDGGGRTSTEHQRAIPSALLAVIAVAVLALSACADGGGTERGTGGATTTTTTTTTTERQASPSTTSGSDPTPEGRGTTAPGGLPFAADTRPDVSSEREGYPVLVSVRQGEHDGYRRYVFTFRHRDPEGHQPWREHARPAWDVRYVPASQAVMDGSGDPVANAGARAHLRIRFQADMHYADGRSSLERSVTDEPPDLVFGGDFENQVTWFYGAEGERPFRALYAGDGRVAVDIVR